jgi:hypothetical protein
MSAQKMMWTVLPNGVEGGRLKLSVIVTPRLAVDGGSSQLGSAFAGQTPWLVRWPEKVLALAPFQLAVEGLAAPLPATLDPGQALDGDLWAAIFPPATPVASFQFNDYGSRQLRSFGVGHVAGGIRDAYTDAARRALPGTAVSAPTTSLLAGLVTQAAAAGLQAKQTLNSPLAAAMMFDATPTPAVQLANAALFYGRGRPPGGTVALPPPPAPHFAQILAMLADQPFLLRRLGIVLDLWVNLSAPLTGTRSISLVAPRGAAAASIDVLPRTVSSFDGGAFRAVTQPLYDSDSADGMLLLDQPSRFVVEHLDVDGAALKMLDFASSQQATVASTGEVGALPPAVRTGGITVSRAERAGRVTARFSRAYQLNAQIEAAGSPVYVYADDIIRGLRVDVKANGAWHTLCARTGSVIVGGYPTVLPIPPGDEGYVKATSTSSPADDPSALNLHEAVFGWDGYSLVAPRPGGDASGGTPGGYSFSLVQDIHATPQSLPRQRFGVEYRVRARVVDLAGNSLKLDPSVDGHASPPLVYTRFEPVAAPVVVLRSAATSPIDLARLPVGALTEGESVEHLVIRSEPGTTAAAYAAAHASDGLAPYTATSERHLAPPKTSQKMAETHGAFDAFFVPGDAAAADAAYQVIRKADGSFLDTQVLDTGTHAWVATSRRIVTPPGVPTAEAVYHDQDVVPRGADLAPGQYVVLTAAQAPLPYLPDPLAAGITFYDPRDPARAPIRTKSFAGSWPEVQPFRLVLDEGTGEPSFTDGAGGSLVVHLPKGTMRTLLYASTIPLGSVPLLAHFAALDPAARSAQQQAIANGQNPLFTPGRPITFVHAVQRPTVKPTSTNLTAAREAGQTFVSLSGNVVSVPSEPLGPSTGHVTLEAAWDDLLDVPGTAGLVTVPHTAHPVTLGVDYAMTSAALPATAQHELGDTKARTIRYKLVGTTRYREYFPVSVTRDEANLVTEGPEIAVLVKSAARPDPPKVVCVVPTFRSVPASGSVLAHTFKPQRRVGGGLRIYLDRPWYSSGEGEQLAVIVANAGTPAGTPVTVGGVDPVWTTNPAPFAPLAPLDAQHFTPAGTRSGGTSMANLKTAESGAPVDAVAFTPQPNSDRKLWYVDVEMSTDLTYCPFVRLALARVQPSSVGDLHLSKIVMTDFHQVVVDRRVTAFDSATLANTIELTVWGIVGTNVEVNDSAGGNGTLPWGGTRNRFQPLPPTFSGFLSVPQGASGHFVKAQVEYTTSSADKPDPLEWRPVGNPVTLDTYVMTSAADPVSAASIFWKANLPKPNVTAGTRFRLAIRELEYYQADPTVSSTDPDPVDGIGIITASDGITRPPSVPYRTRVVYADYVMIS